jgi:3-hydroxyisobutyrate dehydrogenase
MDIGFLGLGQMGAAIAARLLNGGFRLHVFDPDSAAVAQVAGQGATAHSSSTSVAAASEIVFACLAGAKVSEDVADALAKAPGTMRIYVEMSTIGQRSISYVARQLNGRNVAVVDCPVSGGPKGAAAGTLTMLVAGPQTVVTELKPLLLHIGSSVFELGERPGQGQLMKLVNNLISISNQTIASEALVLGTKGGLDPAQMLDVINNSTGRSAISMENLPSAVLTGAFNTGGRLALPYKDLLLGLEEAEALGVPMCTAEAVRQIWRFAMLQGMGEEDFSAIIKVMERWAGVVVRSGAGAG